MKTTMNDLIEYAFMKLLGINLNICKHWRTIQMWCWLCQVIKVEVCLLLLVMTIQSNFGVNLCKITNGNVFKQYSK